MYSRRTFLKISGVLATLLAGGYIFRNSSFTKVKHILSSASHEKLAVSLSLSKGVGNLDLILNNQILVTGRRIDREGKHWQFISDKLLSDTSYELELFSEEESIFKP